MYPFPIINGWRILQIQKGACMIEKKGVIVCSEDGNLVVPDFPVIPFIEGDGTGPDIWRAARLVLDAAVSGVFGDKRRIQWLEV